jgi:hypothetical protein
MVQVHLVAFIAHDDDVLMVHVRHIGGGIAVREYALMPLVQNVDSLEGVASLFQSIGEICVQHVVPAAVAEIADDYGAVAAVLQSRSALAEEVSERLDEF